MKINIDIDEDLKENEIIIRCSDINDDIKRIKDFIILLNNNNLKLSFHKKDTEYFLTLNDILFFETSNNYISAHTIDDVFETKYKLYIFN